MPQCTTITSPVSSGIPRRTAQCTGTWFLLLFPAIAHSLLSEQSFLLAQAALAALPKLPPGLVVAAAHAKDLAARLEAHAAVCSLVRMPCHCCNTNHGADAPCHLEVHIRAPAGLFGVCSSRVQAANDGPGAEAVTGYLSPKRLER